MSELKPLPCPFCGRSNAIICETDYQDRPSFAVSCRTELCHGAAFQLGYGYYATEKEAIQKWNRRASPWISVKDRLPDVDDYVVWQFENGWILYDAIDKDMEATHIAQMLAGNKACGARTHWMRIPPLPEEEWMRGIYIDSPKIYLWRDTLFEYPRMGSPWPVKKDGEPKKLAGKKFWTLIAEFESLSQEQRENHCVGGGSYKFEASHE